MKIIVAPIVGENSTRGIESANSGSADAAGGLDSDSTPGRIEGIATGSAGGGTV